jgi:hypothetical protein
VTQPTEAATFRFEKTILDQLRVEAERKQINLNTLLNQIVKSHLDWHANAVKAGFIPVRKGLIMKLFDPLSRDQIEKIAIDMARGLTDETMIIMAKRRSAEAILELIERWIRTAGYDYHHDMEENSHRHIFVMQKHDL